MGNSYNFKNKFGGTSPNYALRDEPSASSEVLNLVYVQSESSADEIAVQINSKNKKIPDKLGHQPALNDKRENLYFKDVHQKS